MPDAMARMLQHNGLAQAQQDRLDRPGPIGKMEPQQSGERKTRGAVHRACGISGRNKPLGQDVLSLRAEPYRLGGAGRAPRSKPVERPLELLPLTQI